MSSRSSPDLPAPASLAIHLDAVGGIAGDMFVAAMVDALPALEAPVLEAVAAVKPPDRALPVFASATSGALAARRFGAAAAYAHAGAGAGGAGSTYPDLRARIADASLAADVREHALALLALLAQAEARVHGIGVDAVHFHELADWDSLLDVVAAGAIAARLARARWSASSLPRGGGTVRTAHGALPAPAPATVALLEGFCWHDDGVAGERVTPTGAAILRHLVPAEACGGRGGAGRLVGSGCGAGTRTLPGMPNVLRALVFDTGDIMADDAVTTVEFDVDDMTGEELALAADRLRAVAGVIDVSLAARSGKKGRPFTEFRVLARPHAAEAAIAACFGETSTIGLRVRDERRRVLARDEVAAGAPPLPVKRVRRPDGTRTAKAAHDGVLGGAGLAARRRARVQAEQRALEDDE
mgnify:CR=1 FL=1